MKTQKSLSDVLQRGSNNFDILRLVAALAVIIGHAYAISPQPPLQDWVGSLLHFDYSGSLAVKFFFFLSGLLVTNSIIAKPNAFNFLAKRAFRIFPGLLVCLLVAVFIIGPIFTEKTIVEYFFNRETWLYLINNFSLYELQWRLTGVFSESKYGLNGSLWTLPYEVLCYLYLALLYATGIMRYKIISNIIFIAIIGLSFLFPNYLPTFFSQNPESHLLPACFSIGALFGNNKKYIPINGYFTILLIILSIVLKNSTIFQFVFYITLFYASIYIASIDFIKNKLQIPFDASYGIYIYGFMIQQSINDILPNIGVFYHQILSSIIAFTVGVLSWYLIEKKFISYGNKIISDTLLETMKNRIYMEITKLKAFLQKGTWYTNDFMAMIILTIFALAVHAGVLKFIFPGYYSPLYPQHSDFYIAPAFANSSYNLSDLLAFPRPVIMIFYWLIGHLGIQGNIACIITMVLLNCALCALIMKKIFNLKFDWKFLTVFVAYCYLIFSQPFFYTFYAQDAASQLSFFFLIAGAYLFYSTHNKSALLSGFCLFVCSLLAFFSKETYGLAALACAFFWFVYNRKKAGIAAIPFFIICFALLLTVAITLYTKSVFVDPNAAVNSPYKISMNPLTIIAEWFSYAKESVNFIHLAIILFIGFIILKYQKENRLLFLYVTMSCFLGAALSWLPNALLPNHHYSGYSFNGTYLLYLPLLIMPTFWTKLKFHKILVFTTIILCFASPLLNKGKYNGNYNKWVLYQENIQRNFLKALKPLIAGISPSDVPQRILIQGISFPFQPFAFPQSLRVFPNAKYAHFDIANYNPLIANSERNDLAKFISPSDTNLVIYQQVWRFNDEGKLVGKTDNLTDKILSIQNNPDFLTINQNNLESFKATGFYDREDSFRWAKNIVAINLNSTYKVQDTILIELKTLKTPACEGVNPKLSIKTAKGIIYKPFATKKIDASFYYIFDIKTEDQIQSITSISEIIDSSPDTRTLSFPFVGLSIKKL